MLLGLWALLALPGDRPLGGGRAEACAFLRTPDAYEGDRQRARFLEALDAAGQNALFPGDEFFGVPPLQVGARGARQPGPATIPPVLLKAIAWEESGLTMASRSVPFDAPGPALVSFDCGHGIMQVTTGMTVPLGQNNLPTSRQVSVATHYVHNIARGAAILAEKWNLAPAQRPIAGGDTGANPALIENWYFAVWGYNGFTGPASNRSNHPSDPTFGGWPRTAYRCDSTQSRTRYPYQELIFGCAARPPAGSTGTPLWTAVPVTLPNLQQPAFFQPLSLSRFSYPYAGMDIPTPQPAHLSPPTAISPTFRTRALGAPVMSVGATEAILRPDVPGGASQQVEVRNTGTGILSWAAEPSANWIVIDPPAGVALGNDLPCASTGCSRAGRFTITVNPVLLPQSNASGTVRITSPNGGAERTIRVVVDTEFEVGAPGTSRAH